MIAAFFARPPSWVEIGGYTLLALVAVEIAVGKKRLGFAGRGFRRTHVPLAWGLAGLLGVHGTIGVGHALASYLGGSTLVKTAPTTAGHIHVYVAASVGNLPLWLDINGALIVLLFVVQALSGYRKLGLKRDQMLGLHSTVAWLIAISAGTHAILATAHLLLG